MLVFLNSTNECKVMYKLLTEAMNTDVLEKVTIAIIDAASEKEEDLANALDIF